MPDLEDGYQALRFVGKVLIGLAIIALLIMVYRIFMHYNYNLSLSVIALVAGLFLWREHVKASHKIAWIASFFVAIGAGGLVAYWVFMPADLVWAFIKVESLLVLSNLVSPLLVCAIALWVLYRLTRPPVKALWTHNNIKFSGFLNKPSMGFNIGAGVVVATLIIGGNLVQSPEYAQLTTIAIAQAKLEVTPSYKFWVADIKQKTTQSHSTGKAVIYAYKEDAIKILTVSWKDQLIVIKTKK